MDLDKVRVKKNLEEGEIVTELFLLKLMKRLKRMVCLNIDTL